MIVKHWKLAFIMMSKDGHKALFCVTVPCDDQDLWWLGLWWIKGTTKPQLDEIHHYLWSTAIGVILDQKSWSGLSQRKVPYVSVVYDVLCSSWRQDIRGTKRLFSILSVWRSKYCLEFSITWGTLKISRWSFHSCAIFEAYLINSLRFSEV